MLKINTLVVLQVRQAKRDGFLSPRYLVARKVGDIVTIGLIGRAHSETIHAVLTLDGVKRLEDALHTVRTVGRDIQIGIVPGREKKRRDHVLHFKNHDEGGRPHARRVSRRRS